MSPTQWAYVERQNPETGLWQMVRPPEALRSSVWQIYDRDEEAQPWSLPYNRRLMWLLGYVESGHEKVVMPTIIPELRGLPEDLSSEVHRSAVRIGEDGPQRTWMTVKEILDFDWARETCVLRSREGEWRRYRVADDQRKFFHGVLPEFQAAGEYARVVLLFG